MMILLVSDEADYHIGRKDTKKESRCPMEEVFEVCGYEVTVTDSEITATKDGQQIRAETEEELFDLLGL